MDCSDDQIARWGFVLDKRMDRLAPRGHGELYPCVQIRSILSQFDGLVAGYHQANGDTAPLTSEQLYMLNSDGDLETLLGLFRYASVYSILLLLLLVLVLKPSLDDSEKHMAPIVAMTSTATGLTS